MLCINTTVLRLQCFVLKYYHTILCRITHLRCAFFWDVTRCKVLIHYRRFGTIYRSPSSRVEEFLTLEDGTDRLSRNVGKELALYDA